MSVSIHIKDAVKRYGENTVIHGLSLDVKEGEFFTLLGPSGCGKTTLLRMIAGFNTIEDGEIYFNDQLINNVAPEKRNIGMVFQNYAIFPHLSVKKNVAFGLKNRNYSEKEIREKVTRILDTVKMSEYTDRMPENLSGGQQQRIALARAIVITPNVLLMDEPLSNLDAKLRLEMRNVIRNIQKDVGITTVYVTHDQEEAMAVSDRIAVMHDGILEHVGSPREVYLRPANIFVANFIGNTNIIEAQWDNLGGENHLNFFDEYYVKIKNTVDPSSRKVLASVRPNEITISTNPQKGLKAKLIDSIFLGNMTQYIAKIEMGEEQLIDIMRPSTINDQFKKNQTVYLEMDPEKINVFDSKTEKNIIVG